MAYTLTEAAKATGKSKSTILRAIQSHKISAARDELSQGWLIEPVELHRLYDPIADVVHDAPKDEVRNDKPLREVELLREMLKDREGVIDDLRQRLDREGEERRQAQAQLTALLTDQRERGTRHSWWPFGKR